MPVRDSRTTLADGTGPAMHTATVVVPVAHLNSRPVRNTAPETQLLLGAHMRVHSLKSGWAYGLALNPLDARAVDYAGWVRARDLVDTKIVPTHAVAALRAPVFSRPDLKSPIRQSLPITARIKAAGTAEGNGGRFTQLGGGGFVSDKHLRPLNEVTVDFVDTAEAFQGLPYVWGGNSANGMDCSGLVKLALQTAGVSAPRDADQQEAALGRPHRPDSALMNLRRGDLVFWPGHVGVMQTSGRLLHANAHHMRVATEPLRDAVERIGAIRTVKRLEGYGLE